MHAGKGDLLESRGGYTLDLAQHVVWQHAARHPSRRRDDAVRARLSASGLNAQCERRSPGDPGFNGRTAAAVPVAETVCRRKGMAQKGNQPRLVVVQHHAHDVGKRSHFAGSTRCVTTGDDDARVGIVPRDPPDRLARTLVGCRGDGTGVDDDQIRCFRRDRHCARRAKILLEAERVRLIHAAAEGDDGVFHLVASSQLTALGLQRLPPDIVTIVHSVKRNLHDAGVRARDRFGEIAPAADNRQHSPTGGDELSAALRSSCVVDRHARDGLGSVDAVDRLA